MAKSPNDKPADENSVFDNAAPAPAPREPVTNTEEARKDSLETLKQQESMKPEPSQEEADAMKLRAADAGSDAAPYQNRAAKSR